MTKIDKKIVHLYKQGVSGLSIAKKLKLTRFKVYSVLNREKVTRTNKENYAVSFNDRFFKNIKTERQAYFLGLLLADGTILEPKLSSYIVKLDLEISDKEIIEEFAISLGLKTERIKTYSYSHSSIARLSINSDILAQDLMRHGVKPRKTFMVKYPTIPSTLDSHFIRGYFDGDGCITVGPAVKIIGTIALLTEIQRKLVASCSLRSTTKLQDRFPERKTNIRSLEIGGRLQVSRVFRYMYNNSSVFMKRKHKRFQELLYENDK